MATAVRDRSDLLEQLETAREDLAGDAKAVGYVTAGMITYAGAVIEAVTWLLEANPGVDEIHDRMNEHGPLDRAGESRSTAWMATLGWFLGHNDLPPL